MTLGLTAKQQANAQLILNYIKTTYGDNDESRRMGDIALETAIDESNLLNYANANIQASLDLPHDAVGHDHSSVGIFQQQPQWWGTVADLMNVQKATAKFINALRSKNWKPMTNWGAAQAVQNSAYPDGSNYERYDARAIEIRKALWGTTAPKPAPAPAPASVGLVVDGELGPKTIGRWQHVMGTPVDGTISDPSALVEAVQRKLNAAGARDWDGKALKVDGLGIAQDGQKYRTTWALQVYLHTTRDGSMSVPKSGVVKALQARLNTGKF